jgi:hypothetical protein
MPYPIEINFLVEGSIDAAIARNLIRVGGAASGMERITRGKAKLVADLPKYNSAARFQPWLAIRDLNGDAPCPPLLVQNNLPDPSPLMCFRIAVREAESWLMADRDAFAAALGVNLALVPDDPEALRDPKQTVVNLARRSRKRNVRLGLVPEPGAGISIGPEYAAWMIEFADQIWSPIRASNSGAVPSLTRAINCIRRLINRTRELFSPQA